jgi:hypothetical protein
MVAYRVGGYSGPARLVLGFGNLTADAVVDLLR